MKNQIQFSSEEYIILERILQIQTNRAKRTITFSYLVEKWTHFIKEVEKGYPFTIDDYTNDLSVRNLLQEILDALPNNFQLKELLINQDNRFIAITKQMDEPLLPLMQRSHIDWWWFRIPINPGPVLRKWIQSNA